MSFIPQTVTPQQFGAKGDGIANDRFAIDSARAAATAGGNVIFPAGTYNITGAPLSPLGSQRWLGAGVGNTFINQQTLGSGTILIDGVNNVSIEGMSFSGQSAAVIAVRSTNSDCLKTTLRDLEISSLGTSGIGIDLRSSSAKFVGFSFIENVVVGGGIVSGWGSKIGIRVGADDGSSHVVGTTIVGVRTWRTNRGILMDNCDSVMCHGLSIDDVNNIELDFNRATLCSFNYVKFENDGVPNKYINFGVNSSDNRVNGSLANATIYQVTNSGVRNTWNGSDGAGGLVNQYDSGPVTWASNFTLGSRLMFSTTGTFGTSTNSAMDGASIRLGSIACQQKTAPTGASDATWWNFGGTHNSTGPGGSNVSHDYCFPWIAGRPAIYEASAIMVSTATPPTMAFQVSKYAEILSGTFIAINSGAGAQISGGASCVFSLSRTGDNIRFSANVLTNDSAGANVTRNLRRIH